MRNRNYILIFLLMLFAGSIYLPFLLWGGIIVDDWGDIRESFWTHSFGEAYLGWLLDFSARPLAPLPIIITTRIFGLWQYGYIAVNVGVYLAALGLIGRVVSRRIGMTGATLFFIIAACPVISPVVIFSPINQLTATVSLFFWSLSLTFMDLYLIRPKWYWYFPIYLCLLYSFLTYEIILPLTTLTMLLPLITDNRANAQTGMSKWWTHYFLKFIFPVMLVLAATFVWQKIIGPHFMPVDSRLKFSGLEHALIAVFHWCYAIILKTPKLLLKSLLYPPSVWSIFSLIFLGFILAFLFKETTQPKSRKDVYLLLSIGALTFFSSASIYFLNGSFAAVGDYLSRGMSSTWISAALFLACIVQSLQYRFEHRRHIAFGLFLICGLCLHSFCVQRDKYIESWKMQNRIINDVIAQAHAKGFEAGKVIIGDVPRYVPSNYNYEIVFSQPWDFGAALALKSDRFIKKGNVVSHYMKNYIKITDDEIIIDTWKETIGVLWYYRFDPLSGIGTLTKIHDADQLRLLVGQLVN